MLRSSIRRSSPHAFTLVELLVVVGIIAVLISMLLPALNRARASADSIACQSNLRQISIAALMYQNENAGHFVPLARLESQFSYTGNPKSQDRWFHYLEPITNGYAVFNCPVRDRLYPEWSVQSEDAPTPDWLIRGRSEKGATANYAYTTSLGKFAEGGAGKTPMTIMDLRRKLREVGLNVTISDFLMFVDGAYWLANCTDAVNDDALGYPRRYVHPHGSLNAAFVDGHVENLTRDQLRFNIPFQKWLVSAKPGR